MSRRSPLEPVPAEARRRHVSEQYLTASQFRAQRLRQVIGRPQARHGLLGNPRLLPLNDVGSPGGTIGWLGGPGSAGATIGGSQY